MFPKLLFLLAITMSAAFARSLRNGLAIARERLVFVKLLRECFVLVNWFKVLASDSSCLGMTDSQCLLKQSVISILSSNYWSAAIITTLTFHPERSEGSDWLIKKF